MGRFTGQVGLVTGATWIEDGGLNIGGAVATELAAEGAKVVVADRDKSGVDALVERLTAEHGADAVRGFPVDVRNEEQVAALIADTVSAFGRLDVVCSAAGVFPAEDAAVDSIEMDVFDDVLAVNARGPLVVSKHAIPEFRKVGGGAIVNISSTHSFAGDLRLTGYGASKAAVNAVTQYTATQFAREGIRANAVCPGTTTSPPVQRAPEKFRAAYQRHTLNPSLNSPVDVARVAVFLLSRDAAGVNGMLVRADGGLLAHQPFYADLLESR